MTGTRGGYRIEVWPREVEAGGDLTVQGRVSAAAADGPPARRLVIETADRETVGTVELTGGDEATEMIGEIVVPAPVRPGTYVWRAVCAAAAPASVAPEAATSFSFIVRPHPTQVVVWDTPTAVERGQRFGVTVGVKCPRGCRPEGWVVEVRDHEGTRQATASLSDAPWPGTASLYYATVDLTAPDAEGRLAWEARAPGDAAEVEHAEGTARFGVRVAPRAECRVTVVAVDAVQRTPVSRAQVVMHPYRAVTDERGIAELSVPKGTYRLFVSGPEHVPFRWDGALAANLTIRAELTVDLGPSDAEMWS